MDSTPHGAAVKAQGLGVRGPRGWAFQDVDFTAEPGALIAIEGPSGSGRTCLLLALTGRMKTAAGKARVAGLSLPKKMAAVRAVTALAHVPGVAELDPAFTVAEHLHERALLQRRFGGPVRALLRPRRERRAEARGRIDAALEAAGLDPETLPKGVRTSVRDLERLEALRLSVALALIGSPRLLAVDDTDMKLSDEERKQAWAMLRGLAAAGTTVLAVCSQAPGDALVVSTARRPEKPRTEEATEASTTGPDEPEGPERGAEKPGAEAAPGTGTETSTKNEEGAADALAEAGRA
ncbi:ATP-binding cassette domain-containing protein [Streptomyces niger]|uniref:ATP-binding cassette domain-containing protein n=1 Tax=Streptomyces niger TaxID=66373 RepID=UPI00069B1F4B|nr:ATP-binding cassette domain-containing protein [Streptomyces niger]